MWKIIFIAFLCWNSSGQLARAEEDGLRLGDDCESHEDCEDIPNAICNTYDVCKCADDYLISPDNSTCLPRAVKIGDACVVQEQCAKIPLAECITNSCVVAQAVTKMPSFSKPGDNCTEDSQCSFMKGVCKNGTCVLPPLPVLISKVTGLDQFVLGRPCSNESDCSVEGGTCVDKLCRCKEDFVTSQNLKMCLPKAKSVGDKCTETVQCVSLNGSICENEKCVDKIGKFFKTISEKLPPLLVGSSCQEDKECSHMTNALCLENVCQCKDDFITSVTSNSCLAKAKKEGDPCEMYKQCEDIKGSTCINNKCVKPAMAGTVLGSRGNNGSTRTLSQLLAAILFIKMIFV